MIFPMLYLSNNLKEKKNIYIYIYININLAVLPSHDNILIYFSEWRLMGRASLALAFISEALEVVNVILLSM